MIPRLAFAALIAATPAFADISGSYNAQGRNPDGAGYSGTVQIVEANGMVAVDWRVGSQNYSGKGTINGDVVTVDWGQRDPVVYVIMPDGELHGTWADGAGLEKLTPR